MRSWAALAVVIATAAGCDGSTGDEDSRDALVYVATIRGVLVEQPPPEEPDVLPVVYVIAVGEQAIAADVQAKVAADLHDDAEVRFADRRSEAVSDDDEGSPVRDDGVLIALGALAQDGDAIDVAVEVYRSEADWSRRVVTIERHSSQWTVTSSSVLPADES